MIFLISFSEMRNALPQQAGRRTTHIGWWASGNAAQPTNPLLSALALTLTSITTLCYNFFHFDGEGANNQ